MPTQIDVWFSDGWLLSFRYDLHMLVGIYTSIALAEASTAAITSTVLENILELSPEDLDSLV